MMPPHKLWWQQVVIFDFSKDSISVAAASAVARIGTANGSGSHNLHERLPHYTQEQVQAASHFVATWTLKKQLHP
jgi:hypothetical protein